VGVDGTVSWRQLWEQTAGLTGRPQARWLCEEASGAFGAEFVDVLESPVTARSMAHLDAMLARVHAGEPLQYVLGHWSFRHLDLLVDRRVLIPRPETELVAQIAIDLVRSAAASWPERPIPVADLGTGSGALGLSLAFELPRQMVAVWLTDVSPDALDVARANTAGLGMAGAAVKFAQGEWFAALPSTLKGSLGLVVSNPPYIAHGDPAVEQSVREWEPAVALYADDAGLADVAAIATGAAEWLRPGGWLVLEIGTGQGAAVVAVLAAAGFTDVQIRPDLAEHDRIAIARRSDRTSLVAAQH